MILSGTIEQHVISISDSARKDILSLPVDILHLILQFAVNRVRYMELASTCSLFCRIMFHKSFPVVLNIQGQFDPRRLRGLPIKMAALLDYKNLGGLEGISQIIGYIHCDIIVLPCLAPNREDFLRQVIPLIKSRVLVIPLSILRYGKDDFWISKLRSIVKQEHKYEEIVLIGHANSFDSYNQIATASDLQCFFCTHEIRFTKEQLLHV